MGKAYRSANQSAAVWTHVQYKNSDYIERKEYSCGSLMFEVMYENLSKDDCMLNELMFCILFYQFFYFVKGYQHFEI